jgi:hypothetical protein
MMRIENVIFSIGEVLFTRCVYIGGPLGRKWALNPICRFKAVPERRREQ